MRNTLRCKGFTLYELIVVLVSGLIFLAWIILFILLVMALFKYVFGS